MKLEPFDLEKVNDPNYELVTRDGRPARILATDLKGAYPVVAAVVCKPEGDNEFTMCVDPAGRFDQNYDDDYDLFLKPKKKEYWVNLYEDVHYGEFLVGPYPSKKTAIVNISGQMKDTKHIATAKLYILQND